MLSQLHVAVHPALELTHQLLCRLIDIGNVFLLLMLLPGHLDHVQNDDQRHLADDQDFVVLGHLPEHRVGLKHQSESALDRDEHDVVVDLAFAFRHVGGVILLLELVDVVADAGDVGLGQFGPFLDRRGKEILVVSRQAYLGVDDDRRIVRIIDHDVRNQGPPGLALDFMTGVILDDALGKEMDAFRQAGIPEYVRQEHFAEIALDLGIARQCIGQVTGLIGNGPGLAVQVNDFLFQFVMTLHRLLLRLLDGFAEGLEFLLDGLHQFRNRLSTAGFESLGIAAGQVFENLLHLLQFLRVLLSKLLPLALARLGCLFAFAVADCCSLLPLALADGFHLTGTLFPGFEQALERSLFLFQRCQLVLHRVFGVFILPHQGRLLPFVILYEIRLPAVASRLQQEYHDNRCDQHDRQRYDQSQSQRIHIPSNQLSKLRIFLVY